MLPPTARLPEVWSLFEEEAYFVIHAPRQTGKTTAVRAIAETLRSQGIAACWATLETCQGLSEIGDAEPLWIDALLDGAFELPAAFQPPPASSVAEVPVGSRFRAFLRAWAAKLDVPLVLLLDEADVVCGAAAVSFLRQLRAGFTSRGVGVFPTSVALIGMRDLRDYLIQAKDGQAVNPGSPFNIKADSLTLRNFSAQEVAELLGQHTQETGQTFAPEAVAEIARITEGQPFLVNALARICVRELVVERTEPVTLSHVETARERLILARTTHLDSLSVRLQEPRVARIVEVVLLGDAPESIPYGSDDFQYVVDLGLVRRGLDGAEAANPIYREVLVRQLTYQAQSAVPRPAWPWSTPEGRLDFPALLDAFRAWWRENADILPDQMPGYPEAVPHLALCAFLQRVVNGGGRVHREFAAGRGAMDLLVVYGPDRFVVEIKRVRSRDALETVVSRGTTQLSRYLDTLGLHEGWLVVFDVRPDRTWEDRLWAHDLEVEGKVLHVLGA